jgi:hypothetical protein
MPFPQGWPIYTNPFLKINFTLYIQGKQHAFAGGTLKSKMVNISIISCSYPSIPSAFVFLSLKSPFQKISEPWVLLQVVTWGPWYESTSDAAVSDLHETHEHTFPLQHLACHDLCLWGILEVQVPGLWVRLLELCLRRYLSSPAETSSQICKPPCCSFALWCWEHLARGGGRGRRWTCILRWSHSL